MATGRGGSIFHGAPGVGSLGYRIASVGDLTGDGRGDLAVSAPGYSHDGIGATGAVYVIHGGGDAGHPASVSLDPATGPGPGSVYSLITTHSAGGWLGDGLSAGGDIDGDGRADLLLGAPGTLLVDGQAFVLYGSGAGLPALTLLEDLSAGVGSRLTAAPGADAGAFVSGLGDIDGDGLDDLAVVSPRDGRAYILLGDGKKHPDALNLTNDLSTQGILLTGVAQFGNGASDLNRDGINDFVMLRATGTGSEAVVVYGSSTLAGTTVKLETFVPDGIRGFSIKAEHTYAYTVTPGDFDGDGRSDLMVPNDFGAMLIRGRREDFAATVDPLMLAPGQGTLFVGSHDRLRAGGVGDVNGDGLKDIVLVDYIQSGGPGLLYVVFGQRGGLPSRVDLSKLDGATGYRIVQSPTDPSSYDGHIGMAQVVDLNGDGFDDIAAGLPDLNDRAGALAIVYGGPRRMAMLDGADGIVDGGINLGFLGRTFAFNEPDPVVGGGGNGPDDPTVRSDDLVGTDGIDAVDLLAGNDTYAALAGDDVIWAGEGADVVYADGGNDRVHGGAGSDTLEGRAGADLLDGGAGADLMIGAIGNDTLRVDSARDVVIERRNEGIDWLHASVGRKLPADIEHLLLTGDAAIFGAGNDTANRIHGNGAANRLLGAGGNDTIQGGRGADTLNGGAGKDWLAGGAQGQADDFVFGRMSHSPRGSQRDVILDFERGRDRLDLRALDADATRAGPQDLAFAGTTARAHSVWVVETVNGLRLLADHTGDRRPDFEIRMDEVFRLSAQDLLL